MTHPDLFTETSTAPLAAAPPDFWNLIAATKGVPDGWGWFSLQTLDTKVPRAQTVAIVKGAVCTARFARGKRKGEINWAKRDTSTERTLAIPFAELDAFMAKWETDNAACSSCGGTGRNYGARHSPCYLCKGSGKPASLP